MKTPLITIVVSELSESPALLEAAQQLKELGVSYELIPAKTWQNGLELARGDYICFLEPDSQLSEDYFKNNFAVFTDKSNYRKLAMVSSVTKLGEETIFGFTYDGRTLQPSNRPSSIEPYGVQIGYLPGAIIRRSTLNRIKPQMLGVNMHDSQEISLALWQNGLRCVINPHTQYSNYPDHHNYIDTVHTDIEPVRIMWRREMIG